MRSIIFIGLIGLILLANKNGMAEQKIIFTVDTLSVRQPNLLIHEFDPIETCSTGCSEVHDPIDKYMKNGWRIISTIPNQTMEVRATPREVEFKRFLSCECIGNKFVIER